MFELFLLSLLRLDYFLALDFKVTVNSDKSKRLSQTNQVASTFYCVSPPSDVRLVEGTPRHFYIDSKPVSYARASQNYITIEAYDIM